MGTRKQREKQEDLWIAHTELAAAPGHPFYQMLEAPYADVCACLAKPGSKARERGALGVPAFRKIAKCIWKCAP
jgi:hypothetical protein